ncbi:MAG: hypothetical protein M3326_12720 [Actinomycetota bacterium]|nr:hypothetical protein [Actinomycetota bacterium]
MGKKCSRTDTVSVKLVGPRLEGPDDAVDALRLSAGDPEQESVVVLLCDGERRVVFAVDFAGAPAAVAPDVVDCVLAALVRGRSHKLVVGLFRGPGRSTSLDASDVRAVDDILAACDGAEVDLLDVVVVRGRRWRSALD